MSCNILTSGDSLRCEEAIRSRSSRCVESALLESVRMHLASDVPLATLCSGGIDSGLVTACVTRQRPGTHAYVANVVANVAGDVFEGPRAQRVTEHLGVELHRVDVGREDLLRLWPVATWFADKPDYTASEMPMLAIARACRTDGVKVLLSGEGADELFGGYRRHEDTYKMWRAAANTVVAVAPASARTFPPASAPVLRHAHMAAGNVAVDRLQPGRRVSRARPGPVRKAEGCRAARGPRLPSPLHRRSLRPLA